MWMKKLWNTFLWLRHSFNTASHKICWGIKHFWQNMPVLSKLGKNWQINQNLTWIMATWVRLCWGGSRRSLELKKTCLQFVIYEDQQLVVYRHVCNLLFVKIKNLLSIDTIDDVVHDQTWKPPQREWGRVWQGSRGDLSDRSATEKNLVSRTHAYWGSWN